MAASFPIAPTKTIRGSSRSQLLYLFLSSPFSLWDVSFRRRSPGFNTVGQTVFGLANFGTQFHQWQLFAQIFINISLFIDAVSGTGYITSTGSMVRGQ